MVGHSDPSTALSLHDHRWPSAKEGALLETYGLATLVYSTAAFSIVYGFICGLDSVASCSYGMTVEGSKQITTDDETTTAMASETGSNCGGSAEAASTNKAAADASPCTAVVVLDRHNRATPSSTPFIAQSGGALALALRNQQRKEAAAVARHNAAATAVALSWASPPLRGVVGHSPANASTIMARAAAAATAHAGARMRAASGGSTGSAHAYMSLPSSSSHSTSTGALAMRRPPPMDTTPNSTAKGTVANANGTIVPTSKHGSRASPPIPAPSSSASHQQQHPQQQPQHYGSFPPLCHSVREENLTLEQRAEQEAEEERALLSLNGIIKPHQRPQSNSNSNGQATRLGSGSGSGAGSGSGTGGGPSPSPPAAWTRSLPCAAVAAAPPPVAALHSASSSTSSSSSSDELTVPSSTASTSCCSSSCAGSLSSGSVSPRRSAPAPKHKPSWGQLPPLSPGLQQLDLASGVICPSFPHSNTALVAQPDLQSYQNQQQQQQQQQYQHQHQQQQPSSSSSSSAAPNSASGLSCSPAPCPSPSPSPSSCSSSSLIGTWIARCLMLEMFVVCVLIVALQWGTEALLLALGEPAESIPVAGAYVTAASWGLPFVAVYHALNKGLQSSGVVLPVLWISVLAKGLCLLAVYLALYHLSLNLVAVAWILSATMAAQAFAVYAYMRHTGIAEQWWGKRSSSSSSSGSSSCSGGGGGEGESSLSEVASADDAGGFSWSGLREYSVLAFPACMAICLEFWLFDLLGALAGLLPEPSTELAVHYLLFSATLASYMVFSGLSVSVSVLVGQKLGCAGQSENAKRSAIVGTSACLCVSAMLMLLIALFHDTLARALTSQPSLLARFAECVPVLVAHQGVDGLNTCSTQLLRTLGVQKYGVLLHFLTYYVCGVCSGVVLAFHFELGVLGLWVGLCLGVGSNALLATIWLWRYADWDQQSAAAQSRAVAMMAPNGNGNGHGDGMAPNCAGDTPAAYLSTSDSFVGGHEIPCCAPLPAHVDERNSQFNMEKGHATHEHHGN